MKEKYRKMLDAARESPDYWLQGAIIGFIRDLHCFMDKRKFQQKDLAREYGCKEPFISRVLNGNAKLKLETMVKLARAVKAELHIHLSEEDVAVELKPIEIPAPTFQMKGGFTMADLEPEICYEGTSVSSSERPTV